MQSSLQRLLIQILCSEKLGLLAIDWKERSLLSFLSNSLENDRKNGKSDRALELRIARNSYNQPNFELHFHSFPNCISTLVYENQVSSSSSSSSFFILIAC